jgi:hypothetical protein
MAEAVVAVAVPSTALVDLELAALVGLVALLSVSIIGLRKRWSHEILLSL